MNKTISAHYMYFVSSLLFSIGFVISLLSGFFIPYEEAHLTEPSEALYLFDTLLWMLPTGGIVLFMLAFVTSKSK